MAKKPHNQSPLQATRRSVLMGMGAAGVANCASGDRPPTRTAPIAEAAATRSSERPNILFIMTDQECGFDLFPQGLLERLPGRQNLLSRGLSFRNYHVHTTPCSPSRSTIYTGHHTQKTCVIENSNRLQSAHLDPSMPTLGSYMRRLGYRTIYKGKWHLSSINGARDWNREVRLQYPNTRDALEAYGFSDYGFDGEDVGLTWSGYTNDKTVAADAASAIQRMGSERTADGAPWFMAVNFVNPHDIMFFDATGMQWKTRIAPDFVSPMRGEPGDPLYAENLNPGLPLSFHADDLSTKPSVHPLINSQNIPLYGEMPLANKKAWRRFRNYYFNCIRDVDRQIEQLLWALNASGQDSNTIIVFTSDHGERAGAHGMRQKGGTVYREEVHVPMVIAHPDGAQGQTTDRLMSAVDIVPTLLSLTQAPASDIAAISADLPGIDVSNLVAQPNAQTERDERGHLFNYGVIYTWSRDPSDPQNYDLSVPALHRGVFDGRYKFARYFAPNDHHLPGTWEDLVQRNELELYDTDADPEEIHNLAYHPDRYRETLMKLSAQTNALIEREIGRDEGQEYPGSPDLYRQ